MYEFTQLSAISLYLSTLFAVFRRRISHGDVVLAIYCTVWGLGNELVMELNKVKCGYSCCCADLKVCRGVELQFQ